MRVERASGHSRATATSGTFGLQFYRGLPFSGPSSLRAIASLATGVNREPKGAS